MGCPLVQGGILGTRSAKGTAAPASCTDDFQAAGGRPPPGPTHLAPPMVLLFAAPPKWVRRAVEGNLSRSRSVCFIAQAPSDISVRSSGHLRPTRHRETRHIRPTRSSSSHLPTARYPACCRTTQTSAGASCAGRDVSRETMPILAPLWDQCQATLTLRFVPASLMSLTARRAVTLVA